MTAGDNPMIPGSSPIVYPNSDHGSRELTALGYRSFLPSNKLIEDFFHIFFHIWCLWGTTKRRSIGKYLDLIGPLVEPKGAETDIPSRDLDLKANCFWGFEVEGVLLGAFSCMHLETREACLSQILGAHLYLYRKSLVAFSVGRKAVVRIELIAL